MIADSLEILRMAAPRLPKLSRVPATPPPSGSQSRSGPKSRPVASSRSVTRTWKGLVAGEGVVRGGPAAALAGEVGDLLRLAEPERERARPAVVGAEDDHLPELGRHEETLAVGAVVVGEDRPVEHADPAAGVPRRVGHASLQVAPEQESAGGGLVGLVVDLVLRRAVREMERVVVGELRLLRRLAPRGVVSPDEVAAVERVGGVVFVARLVAWRQARVEVPLVAVRPLVVERRFRVDVDRRDVGQPASPVHEHAEVVVAELGLAAPAEGGQRAVPVVHEGRQGHLEAKEARVEAGAVRVVRVGLDALQQALTGERVIDFPLPARRWAVRPTRSRPA
jgi:hypothetical protein